MKVIDQLVRISAREVYELLKEARPPERGGEILHSTPVAGNWWRQNSEKVADRKDESR